MIFNPIEDGITHINVYTKSNTDLGRKLTNLYSYYPKIELDLGKYLTLEGYWYTLKINSLNTSNIDYTKELEELKSLNGFYAKKLGTSIVKELMDKNMKSDDDYITDEFKTRFKIALLKKIETVPNLKEDLKNCTLPLAHYYYYGDVNKNPKVIYLPQHQWMIDYIMELRALN